MILNATSGAAVEDDIEMLDPAMLLVFMETLQLCLPNVVANRNLHASVTANLETLHNIRNKIIQTQLLQTRKAYQVTTLVNCIIASGLLRDTKDLADVFRLVAREAFPEPGVREWVARQPWTSAKLFRNGNIVLVLEWCLLALRLHCR